MELSTLIYAEREGVAWVTLNRPDVYNAFDDVMLDEMAQVWQHVRDTDSVRVAVVTAAGDRAFCTGIDRQTIPDEFAFDPFTHPNPGDRISPKAHELWKPVIAAVNGIACGGAFYLLGDCDIIIASSNATFFDPHVTYGMTAAFESVMLLSKMPFAEVLRVALMGNYERMSAERAMAAGLVTQVVEPDELEATAAWIASSIAAQPAGAIRSTLRTVWAARDLSTDQGMALGNVFVNLSDKDALVEGQKAFTSGERVQWRLR